MASNAHVGVSRPRTLLDYCGCDLCHRVNSRQCEEIRQSRLQLEQLNAMIDELRSDLRQLQQAGSLPATPAGKHELN
jgi:hypothetical protein